MTLKRNNQLDANILATIHDAIFFEVKAGDYTTIEKVSNIMKDCANKTLSAVDYSIKDAKEKYSNGDEINFVITVSNNGFTTTNVGLTNDMSGEFNVSKYVDKVVSIDVDELKQDILNEASLRTYEAYGRKQLEFAINNLINNKKFNGFVNDDNVRLHLINKVSPDEVKNIIKNDLLSNNYPGSIIQEKYITLYINKIEKEAKG